MIKMTILLLMADISPLIAAEYPILNA